MIGEAQVQIYETPLFGLTRQIADSWKVPFRIRATPFNTSEFPQPILALKQEEHGPKYDEQHERVLSHQIVEYGRLPSKELAAKIVEQTERIGIDESDAAVKLLFLLPQLYKDQPSVEFAYFKKRDFTSGSFLGHTKETRVNIDERNVRIEVGRDGHYEAIPELERMVTLDKGHIVLRPHAAFDAIKEFLMR